MRILVWQWGRRGAGPLVARTMASQLAEIPGVETCLSLSTGAELLQLPQPPVNDVPMRTYENRRGLVARSLTSPWQAAALAEAIGAARVDVALCAMPAPLDFVMAAALRQAGVPYAVVVHDAERHPGDTFPLQMPLQRWLIRRAGMLFALSAHVAEQLRARGLPHGQPLRLASLPPFVFWPPPPPVGAHGGKLRLLSFGRLLPYKGLDLLADALAMLGARDDIEVRVLGSGPDSAVLDRLRGLANVVVENRWVPEADLGAVLGWADALVLSHREASQSGVAAAAIAARRWVVATRVGGLTEQLSGQDMAILCDPEPTSLAAAIGTLPGRTAPGGTAMPAWNGTAQVMVDALRDMVGSRPQGAEARVTVASAQP